MFVNFGVFSARGLRSVGVSYGDCYTILAMCASSVSALSLCAVSWCTFCLFL